MLVLKIDSDDGIFIGNDIRITATPIGGKRVKLLIQAPEHIPVHRQKVLQRILGPKAFEQFILALEQRCGRKARPEIHPQHRKRSTRRIGPAQSTTCLSRAHHQPPMAVGRRAIVPAVRP